MISKAFRNLMDVLRSACEKHLKNGVTKRLISEAQCYLNEKKKMAMLYVSLRLESAMS